MDSKQMFVTAVPVVAAEAAEAVAVVAVARCPAAAAPAPEPESAVALPAVVAREVDLRPALPWAAVLLARERLAPRLRLLQAMNVLRPVRLGRHKTIATRAPVPARAAA